MSGFSKVFPTIGNNGVIALPRFHDSEILGLNRFVDLEGDGLRIDFRTEDGRNVRLNLRGVGPVHINNFSKKNIVFDVIIHSKTDVSQVLDASEPPLPDMRAEDLLRLSESVRMGARILFEINATQGCDGLCACTSFEIEQDD